VSELRRASGDVGREVDAGHLGECASPIKIGKTLDEPAQVGITHTAARSDTVMRKHNALARRLIDRQDDYLRFTKDRRIPRYPTTTAPSGTSA
jgi:hypothetical protein